MVLSDPILAGEQLIPSGIRSANYVPGTAGWRIAKDGSAEFYGVTIRADLQSANFSTGTAGWKLESATGNAELNQLVARGSIATDVAGQARIVLFSSAGNPPPAGVGVIEFYSARPEEIHPARVRSYGIGGPPSFLLEGPDTGGGQDTLQLTGGLIFTPAVAGEEVVLGAPLFIPDTPDVTLSGGGGLTLGFSGSGLNMALDNNEIQARDASVFPQVASTLNLQNEGGLLQIGGPILCSDMRAVDSVASGNVVTASTTFVTDNTNGPNRTFTYAPSGRALVLISADAVNSGAGFSNMSFRIRDTNAAGTVRFTGGSDETIRVQGTNRVTAATAAVVTGLPTSGTGFIEGLYLASSGTATFRNADIVVIPVT